MMISIYARDGLPEQKANDTFIVPRGIQHRDLIKDSGSIEFWDNNECNVQ